MFSLNIMNHCKRIPLPRTFGPRASRALSSHAPINQQNDNPPHTSDTYSKETDTTPPADSKIHRMDPESENVQKPHEPPSGSWSRAGTQTKEYASVSKERPYDALGGQYNAKPSGLADKRGETSGPGEGPEGTGKGGRKPERR